MILSTHQIQAILNLSGPQRYKHFIKVVADTEELWGLYQNGWALAGSKEKELFPLWPHKDYAELCKKDEWSNYLVRKINLYDFKENYFESFEKRRVELAIFYTPLDKGIVVPAQSFWKDIEEEIDNNY